MKSEWCMSPLYYKLSTIYVQPLQKKYKNKKRNPLLSYCVVTVENTALIHLVLTGFFFKSVCSFQDWSMWSVRPSDRRKHGKVHFVLIGSLEKKRKFFMLTSPPESKKTNLQSLLPMARYGEKLRYTHGICWAVTGSFWGWLLTQQQRRGRSTVTWRQWVWWCCPTPQEHKRKHSASSCVESQC